MVANNIHKYPFLALHSIRLPRTIQTISPPALLSQHNFAMTPSAPAQALISQNSKLETAQPTAGQSMNLDTFSNPPQTTEAQSAQAEQQEELHLRGGEACPGRFCFIIPCPIPCNFCII
ncbi:hypothetical protein BJ878DRAFT_522737 [Calycina marina]|uniref:Uncharacterized protein n=1 Tax=Calycina marina TaxID=1763456 RepID=A0A9P7YWH5_9HELO|nr:hypothetical protein BJ878DRAFT_522737 [Calycina marina]